MSFGSPMGEKTHLLGAPPPKEEKGLTEGHRETLLVKLSFLSYCLPAEYMASIDLLDWYGILTEHKETAQINLILDTEVS